MKVNMKMIQFAKDWDIHFLLNYHRINFYSTHGEHNWVWQGNLSVVRRLNKYA